ncbi:MAG: BatD family protein, partial [Myxococcota bacterium]
MTRLKVIGAGHASGAKTIAAHGPMRLRITTRGLVAMGLFLGFSLMASWVAQAQDVQLQTDRGPHYIGEPITVQIVASQFDENSTPEVDVPEIVGGRLRYAGVSDSSSTSISLINGKLTRSKEVRFIYRYELVVDRDGVFNIPAFRVRQGTTSRTTRPERIRVSSAARTGLVSLELNLPEGPIFVGQKVPIEVVLRVDREAQRDLISLTSSVPLFENKDVRFLDEPVPGADAQLELETSLGTIALPAIAKEIRIGGRAVLEVRAKRTMIALSTGEIRASAPRAMMSRGRGFRKGLFNQRQATSSERLMAEGDPVRLEVIEVPRAGRPPSFAGAVGQGFTLEVSADRSVVQLGEPITLQFRLQGEGDLTTAGLPPFDAAGLFDPKQFRLPEEAPAGLVDESGKHFEASLRVLDAGVREIPAVAYSWFDAGTRTYQTTHSRPIALLVGAAQIIGADDVARRSGDASLGAS